MTDDARLILGRSDLAAAELQGVWKADAYRTPERKECWMSVADVRRGRSYASDLVNQLLLGEQFDVLEVTGGSAWGRCVRDGYVGYVRFEMLEAVAWPPTHRVTALRAYGYVQPDFKAVAREPIALNAFVRAVDAKDGYILCKHGGWIAEQHLTPIGEAFGTDWAGVAELFLHTPYRWGGRDGLGIDCSGLVQQSLFACGLGCPRDADQQARLGEAVDPADLRRGDLVGWRGHIGMMLDETRLIHANTHHMGVAIEPLAEAMARIEGRGGGAPTAFRRISLP
jgi:hypothetical protein